MANIETTIVEMQFDGRNFTNGLKAALSSLDRFKNALNFRGATDGLGEVQRAANGINFTVMSNAINGISGQFTVLGATAAGVFSNMINQAMATANQMSNKFIISPVSEGFQEYEQNIDSIGTILANTKAKGSTLADVNKHLDELNHYADNTIYSFKEMTRNIGTFTAAGVGLEDATTAIKGLANAGAFSGAQPMQVASAMYQMSQALSAGKMGLMDWNSLVNSSMGSETMRDMLIETSRAMGTGADAAIAKKGNFRESLQEGWITLDVMRQTFANFSGDVTEDQLRSIGYSEEAIAKIIDVGKTAMASATDVRTFSGMMASTAEAAASSWAQTWMLLFGDYEEAKTFWTSISDVFTGVIQKMNSGRNEMLVAWDAMGGRTLALEALGNVFKSIVPYVERFHGLFREVFPPMTAERLFELTNRFLEFSRTLHPSEERLNKVMHVFRGVFNILKSLQGVGGAAFTAIRDFLKAIGRGFAQVFDLGNAPWVVGDFFNKFAGLLDVLTGKMKLSEGVLASVEAGSAAFFRGILTGIDWLGEHLPNVKTYIVDTFNGVVDWMLDFGGAVAQFVREVRPIENIKENFSSLGGAIMAVIRALQLDDLAAALGNATMTALNWAGEQLSNFFNDIPGSIRNGIEGVQTAIPKDFLSWIGVLLTAIGSGQFVWEMWKMKDEGTMADRILRALKKMIFPDPEDLEDEADGWFNKIKRKLQGKGDRKEGLLADFRRFLVGDEDARNDEGLLGDISEKISDAFEPLTNALGTMQNTLRAGTLMLIAIAVASLTASVIALSMIDGAALAKALTSIGALFLALGLMMLAMVRINWGKMEMSIMAVAGSMLVMAKAIAIMSVAIIMLSSLDQGELTRGLIGIGTAMGVMVGAFVIMSAHVKTMPITASAMTGMAGALMILAWAVRILAHIDPERLSAAVASLVMVMLSMATSFVMIGKNVKALAVGAKAMLAMTVSISALAAMVIALSAVDPERLVPAVASLATTMLILVSSFVLLSKYGGQITVGTGAILGMTVALSALSTVIIALSFVDPERLASSVATLASTMLILVNSFLLMSKYIKQVTVGNSALLTMTLSLTMLSGVIVMLAQLDWNQLAIGLTGLAGAMTIMVGAMVILGKFQKNIVQGAGATVILAASMLLLSESIKTIGGLDLATIGKGLGGVAVMLAILAGAMYLLPKDTFTKSMGLTMIIMSVKSLGEAVVTLGQQDLKTVGKGLLALAGGLTVLILAMNMMNAKSTLGSMALVAAALAIALFIPPLLAMSQLPFEDVAKGIGLLAIALGVVIGAAFLAQAASVGMYALAMVIGVLGATMVLVVGTFTMFATVLTALIIAFVAMGPAAKEGFELLISLVPSFMKAIGDGVVAFIKAISEGLGAILQLVSDFIGGVLNVIKIHLPTLFELISMALSGILGLVEEHGPRLVDVLFVILTAITAKLTEYIPVLGALISALISEIIRVITEAIPQLVQAGVTIAQSFIDGITTLIPYIVEKGLEMVVKIVEGIASNMAELVSAGMKVIEEFLRGVADSLPGVIDAGFDVLVSFLEGLEQAIRDNSEQIRNSAVGIADAIVDGITGGITDKLGSVYESAKSVGSEVLDGLKDMLDINSPSKEARKIGRWFDEGFINGVSDGAKDAAKEAGNMGRGAITEFQKALGEMNTTLDSDILTAPTIRPVVDMSDVTKKAGLLSNLFSGTSTTMDLSARINQNGSASEEARNTANTVNFVQNITSPRALDHGEVYRQTRNGLALTKAQLGV